MTKTIDAALACRMIVSGAYNLSNNREFVDSLNVFPVPDGDTGTNMSLTFINAARAVENESFASPYDVFQSVAKATLRGARGNSGVILSQIFRGISKSVSDSEEIDISELKAALRNGSDTAYRAVMKPTEGTILTVIRSVAEAAEASTSDDLASFFGDIKEHGNAALKKTQEMLPQLKNAGVVDAGGQGLMFIFEGFCKAILGSDVSLTIDAPVTSGNLGSAQSTLKTEDIKYAYCTEFIINKYNEKTTASKMRASIENKGDCMIVIDEDDIVKVHIHTNHPGFVLEQAVKIGELVNIKIENMKEQHTDLLNTLPAEKNKQRVPVSVAAVCNGCGLEKAFTDLGVGYIIRGGQTMNPSTDDILEAVNSVNADTVFVLPNNKNIILAANQAAEIAECKVLVIETKTIPQGIAAMMEYSPSGDIDKTAEKMRLAAENIKSGSVTHAVKDTNIDGLNITAGDIIGVSDGHILSSNKDINSSAIELISALADDDSEIITIYYGNEINEDTASVLAKMAEDKFPDADIIVTDGGQSVYFYLVSVE